MTGLWIGFGCRQGCSVQALHELLQQTLLDHALNEEDLQGMASIDLKAREPALLALAERLGLPFATYGAETLAPYQDRLSHHSARSFAATGCMGVAESAALALAEHCTIGAAVLRVKRRHSAVATLAIACTEPHRGCTQRST
jgi:cobalt-precorrin 5A hydrolase